MAASLSTTLSREERGTDTVTDRGPGDSWPKIYYDPNRGFVLLDKCIHYLVHDGHVLLDGGLVLGVVHHHVAQVDHVMEDGVALARGKVGPGEHQVMKCCQSDQVRSSGGGQVCQVFRWGQVRQVMRLRWRSPGPPGGSR